MIDKAKLEDAIDATDRARTRVQIAAMQLAAGGLKDSEEVARLKAASEALTQARKLLIDRRTA